MTADDPDLNDQILARCQVAVQAWRGLSVADFEFDAPKGFSSITLGVRARPDVDVTPSAVLYRQLAGKQNAILDFDAERDTFLLLGRAEIAASCLYYDREYRIEEFYRGRSLRADDVFQPEIQRKIAHELHRFHRLTPPNLPERTFFALLHERWGAMAEDVLRNGRSSFPPAEQTMCDELAAIHSDATHAMVMRCLPDRAPVFCHNDTYHGNVFLFDDDRLRLLDFEFACLNHAAFDFANLFAETVMEHGLVDPPHFRIGTPRFSEDDLARFIDFYLDNETFDSSAQRSRERRRLIDETRRALLLSDYMYAMAALPLALHPIQKIRFIPYAHQRFQRFLANWHREFDGDPI